jgi:Tfp pilus assembly protein PilF
MNSVSRNAIIFAVVWVAAVLLPCSGAAAEPTIASGNIDELIRTLSNRTDPASLNMLSRAYYAIEQWDSAIKNGEKAVNQAVNSAEFHWWLGRQYGEKAASVNPLSAASLAGKTRNQFELAVKLDPTHVQAQADLAEYYVEAPSIMGGGLDKAREQASLVSKYDAAASHWILFKIAEKDKHYDEAEQQLQAAIKVARNPAQYWMNLASFYRGRSRPDDMLKAISQAVAQPDKSAEVYYDAASLLLRAGVDFPSAIQYLKTYLDSGAMVEDAPAFRARYVLGQIYEKQGNKAAAASEYKAAIALASGFTPASKALGRVQ